MDQSFLLKHYGHLSIEEQNNMTAEDRMWWIRRINEERERKENANKNVAKAPGKLDATPGRPPA